MSMDLGRDLKLRETELGADLTISSEGDLMLIEGEENLGQAIINRLRTRVGELRDLGHPRYGSTLYEMIGQPNNDRTRSLVRMIVRETIMRDRRVKEIISLTITTSKRDLNRLNI
ncbi:MAG: hypothetical protein DRJ34_01690, partial [Thermoprotei archaeon]